MILFEEQTTGITQKEEAESRIMQETETMRIPLVCFADGTNCNVH